MKQIKRMQHQAKRNSLNQKQTEEKNRQIQENVLKLPEYEKAKKVMAYYAIGNEAKTDKLIEKALGKGKKVYLPTTDFPTKKITPTEISSLKDLKKTKQGLLEPNTGKEGKAQELDLIIVPGIAFDRQGNRIGTGQGFYDNLLRKVSTKTSLLGICFQENLEEKLPTESHDIKMDIIVTDKETVRCRQ